jgi:hypothetical protein
VSASRFEVVRELQYTDVCLPVGVVVQAADREAFNGDEAKAWRRYVRRLAEAEPGQVAVAFLHLGRVRWARAPGDLRATDAPITKEG